MDRERMIYSVRRVALCAIFGQNCQLNLFFYRFQSKKLKQLRELQDRIDMLEAEKDSLVNQTYDLRQLLQKVNKDGELKLTHIKNKNVLIALNLNHFQVTLKTKIQSLLQALDIARANSTHFENVASYWSWSINSYCDDECTSQDQDTISSSPSFNSCGHHELPSLSIASTCYSSEKSSVSSVVPIICGEEEPEREEREKLQHQQLMHLLQPKLLNLKSTNNRGDRDRDSDCGRKISKGGAKSVEAAQDTQPTTTSAVDAIVTAGQQ